MFSYGTILNQLSLKNSLSGVNQSLLFEVQVLQKNIVCKILGSPKLDTCLIANTYKWFLLEDKMGKWV